MVAVQKRVRRGAKRLMVGAIISCILWFFLRTTGAIPAQNFPGIPAEDLATFSSHAVNNTVIIVPINKGMLHWSDNLLCSLTRTDFDTSRIVFWALDEGAETVLKAQDHATYRDPNLFSSSKNENYRGNTAAYTRMMRERPKFFINILSAGFDLLMLDADIIFWRSPLELLPSEEERNRVDAIYSTDAREWYQTKNAFRDEFRRGKLMPPICNGLFWMKSTEQTIKIWSDMLDVFQRPGLLGWWFRRMSQSDQTAMDVLLNDGRAGLVGPYPDGITSKIVPKYKKSEQKLNVRLLDQTLVTNGHLLKNRNDKYNENLAKLRKKGGDRLAIHFNWSATEITKEEGARIFGMYYLDDQGKCKLNQ